LINWGFSIGGPSQLFHFSPKPRNLREERRKMKKLRGISLKEEDEAIFPCKCRKKSSKKILSRHQIFMATRWNLISAQLRPFHMVSGNLPWVQRNYFYAPPYTKPQLKGSNERVMNLTKFYIILLD
jgi:hypothetical protein